MQLVLQGPSISMKVTVFHSSVNKIKIHVQWLPHPLLKSRKMLNQFYGVYTIIVGRNYIGDNMSVAPEIKSMSRGVNSVEPIPRLIMTGL